MIKNGLPNFIRIVLWEFFNFTFRMSFDTYFLNFQNSIRAHVLYRAFATLIIKLYRVVDYDSKWSTKFHNECMLGFFQIVLLRCHLIYIYFFNFQNSIRGHVRYRAFATIQTEMYCVVDYDSKWSTKFQKDCMLGIF